MEIPGHIVQGLGPERVTRIRMAWDYARARLGPTSDDMRMRLAESIVMESRNEGLSVREIVDRAISRCEEPA